MNDVQLAKYLGYFSIALGVTELVAGRRITQLLGLPVSPALVQAFGAREIGAGLAVLTYPDSPGPVWSRVGGDVLDLLVLGSALRRGNRQRTVAMGAIFAVLAVTTIDLACASALAHRQGRARRTARRTRVQHAVV